ncbi:LAME_0E00144g1_1 [Lachancea meyersii CBS 8951]|uniref:LAME_0E00144g1_1 n=1 Tax=Lachancea meyersii CBS 8951 TaxID=1266667 RepID=A0A1G4JE67_9SACH|nr:LAME_0E00144g1_1 [Lachancea meyersii CBS 8951]
MTSDQQWWAQWSPDEVSIGNKSVSDTWKICTIQGVYFGAEKPFSAQGARISSIFVIFFVSTICTLFPVTAARFRGSKVLNLTYLFARSFGTGVIIATAFIHLLDPAYSSIGSVSCVGLTGHWADYPWCPAIVLVTVFVTFFIDLASDVYVNRRFGKHHGESSVTAKIIKDDQKNSQGQESSSPSRHFLPNLGGNDEGNENLSDTLSSTCSELTAQPFEKQIGAFLTLELGVIFHSVVIGLNLGSTTDNFYSLYIVLVFHQSFEGLGIGARLSAIKFPGNRRWWPYALCVAYGLSTPISIAIGLGVRNVYNGNSFTVHIVSGTLDAVSTGVLIYTGLVELLARDYIFNRERTDNVLALMFMLSSTVLGAALMALLGKWA